MSQPSPLTVLESLTLNRSAAPAPPGATPGAGGPLAAPAPAGLVPEAPAPAAPAPAGLVPEVPAPEAPRARGAATPRHPAPQVPGSGRSRRYGLRGRHVREHRLVRVGLALATADIAGPDDLLVLQALRRQPLGDLDAAQVSALAALPPSIVASALDRLVRSGLARDAQVGGRIRFGLP